MSTAPKLGSTAWPTRDALPLLVLQGMSAATVHVAVSYQFARPPAVADQQAVSNAMHALANAGFRGAFPCSGIAGPSSMEFLGAALSSEACGLQLLQLCNIDERAFQLLRNMVARLRAEKVLVDSIQVMDTEHIHAQPVQPDWPDEDNEEAAYPTPGARAAALLAFEDTDFSKVRRCLVEVDNRLFPDQVTRFAAWVRPWYALLEAGAFAMPVGHPAVTDSIAGFVSQFDPVTIEVAVDRFMASECAWGILANMVCAFDWQPRTLAAIAVD
ncbi:hypothetical protein OU994_19975 [Pseudoduganella sp. SL102]|uniref:hypothetical protein n=1 Tax=Pseudoduganella sp. SL102 TaxID=2995154 RepID=UPI00248AFD22|nr:hypothetical protein [Pseudoduganella sp. SL102]WBS00586.1 hypothetical protein OU994_19975 [Pseudoduganella sp. SL102]